MGKCNGRGKLVIPNEGVFEGNFLDGERGEKGVWWYVEHKCPTCFGTITWPHCSGHVYMYSKKLGTLSELEKYGHGGPAEKQSRKDHFLQLANCKIFEEKADSLLQRK